jgi:hypothetical protein
VLDAVTRVTSPKRSARTGIPAGDLCARPRVLRSCVRVPARKVVFKDEISDHYAAGRSVLLYQHFPREHRPTFQDKIASNLSGVLPRSRIWFFGTAHVTFVLAARPEHWHRVTTVVDEIAREWPAYFSARRRDASLRLRATA